MKITKTQVRSWIKDAKNSGFNPNILIIPEKINEKIEICGIKYYSSLPSIFCNNPIYIGSFGEIGIFISNTCPKNRAYLTDKRGFYLLSKDKTDLEIDLIKELENHNPQSKDRS